MRSINLFYSLHVQPQTTCPVLERAVTNDPRITASMETRTLSLIESYLFHPPGSHGRTGLCNHCPRGPQPCHKLFVSMSPRDLLLMSEANAYPALAFLPNSLSYFGNSANENTPNLEQKLKLHSECKFIHSMKQRCLPALTTTTVWVRQAALLCSARPNQRFFKWPNKVSFTWVALHLSVFLLFSRTINTHELDNDPAVISAYWPLVYQFLSIASQWIHQVQ